jgi:hypothetical protein
MELNQKFANVASATSNTIVWISTLSVGCRYTITSAERVTTRFGPTVLLGIIFNELQGVKVFLPKRYSAVFSDSDTEDINMSKVKLFLIYKGTCEMSRAILLDVEK